MNRLRILAILLPTAFALGVAATAQDNKEAADLALRRMATANVSHTGSSPFTPPTSNDQTFVVDSGAGLDTGCTYRNGGPLVIKLNITRVIASSTSKTAPSASDIVALENQGIVSRFTQVAMPAYDVDYYAATSGYQPERDIVSINGHVLQTPSQYLTGLDNTWVMNRFDVPTEWLNFPADPGPGGTVTPAPNTIQIDIDQANLTGSNYWCTSIDWVSASLRIVRPVLFVHGILTDHTTWLNPSGVSNGVNWATQMKSAGIPSDIALDLGINGSSIALDSIGNNAGKIATRVASLRAEYGVDAVNVVSHSKGGLDTREYVRTMSDVDKLIMIGTPNAGTPLADFGLSVALENPGLGAIYGVLGGVKGPALLQLTTLYMGGPYCSLIKLGYNCYYIPNPNVTYLTYPGKYTNFDLPSSPIAPVLSAIVGEGDLAVPLTSVPLYYAANAPAVATTGTDTQGIHANVLDTTGMSETNAPAFFRQIFPLLQAPPALTVAAQSRSGQRPTSVAEQQSGAIPLAAAAPAAQASTIGNTGSLTAGTNATGSIKVDSNSSASFLLQYVGGDLDLTLTSPSGLAYTAASSVNNPDFTYAKAPYLGGNLISMTIKNAAAGAWTYKIVANSVTGTSGSVSYGLNAALSGTTITLAGSFVSPTIHVSDPLQLRATLTNGSAPLTGATVTALVTLPDSTTATATLRDDGTSGDATANDGIYSANFTQTTQAGYYSAIFQATGSTPSFERQDLQIATISGSTSAFAGSYTASVTDTDSDGFYNELDIVANLKITAAGTYLVTGVLTDAKGNTLNSSTQSALSAGTVPMKLVFDGAALYTNGVDGPYTLSQVTLAEITAGGPLLDDTQKPAFNTTAYKASAFEHAALSVTGSGTATGVDTNNNKLFDQLSASFGVNVSTAGSYQWSARLTDKNGVGITLANNSGTLTAGANTLTLSFPGSDIGTHGVNGPYQVNDLLIYGTASLSTAHVFTTGAFTASQFEGFISVNQISTSTSIALTSPSSGTIAGGTPVTVTATVAPTQGTGQATGNVVFTVDGVAQTAVPLTGYTASSTLTLAGGPHTYTAAYSGDGDYAASSSSTLTITVNAASTALALAANPTTFPYTSSTTLTATVTSAAKGTIAGNVTFNAVSSGTTTQLGKVAVTLDSTGAYSAKLMGVTFKAAGTYVVTASYDGNASYAAAISSNVTLTVQDKGDLTLGSVPSSISLSYGGKSSYSLPITTTNGFSDPITLACSGLPTGASCQFVAGSVSGNNSVVITPDASGKYASPVQFTVTAPATKASLDRAAGDGTVLAMVSPLLGLLLLPACKGRRKIGLLCALMVMTFSMTLAGCGNSSTTTSSPVTSTGTLTVSSTGANAINHTYSFTLTLQ